MRGMQTTMANGKNVAIGKKPKRTKGQKKTPGGLGSVAQRENANPYLPKPCKVLSFFRESPANFTLTVDMKGRHAPGQFVQVSLPGYGEAPISICSDSEKYLQLNVREIGHVTTALAKMRKG